MIFIYLLLIIGLAAFINYIIQKLRKDKKYKRKFYDFGDNSSLVYVLLALIVAFFVITYAVNDPTFESSQEQITYGKSTTQPWLVSDAYKNQVQSDSNNIDLQFNFISSHFDPNQDMGPDRKLYQKEASYIFNLYSQWSKRWDPKREDLGELCLGIYYYFRNDKTLCKTHLEKVRNDKLKYLNTYMGLIHYYYNDPERSEQSFAKEIRLFGDVAGAYKYLALTWNEDKRYKDIAPLVYDDYSRQFIPYHIRTHIFILHHDVVSYFRNLCRQIFKNTNLIGFTGALLILFVWVMYVRRVNVYAKGKWKSIVFTVVLSSILVFPVWLLYDTYEHLFEFSINGEAVNDFLYCVFGIGAIEELIKFIPFLIILKFTKAVKEPIDYIMYASLSALGFAFVENFRYFDDGSINIIHSRALTASIAHVCLSSIIAYGLILARFKHKKSQVLYFLLFYLIAAFAHGFYDFWLISSSVEGFGMLTFLLLLTGILAYSSFVNNALNNSSISGENIRLNTARLSSDLAAGLIFIFLFEYICLTWIYGPTIGNRELLSSTFSGGYMILFVSVRLSNIDILPGEWSPIDFFVGLMPNQIIYGDRKPNFNSLVGMRISLKAFKKKGYMINHLPIDGEIIQREKISGFTGWFLVKLDKPFQLNKMSNEYILIRAKDKLKLIEKNADTVCSCVLIPDMSKLSNPSKKLKDFVFVEWIVVS
jgi:protease PrsW